VLASVSRNEMPKSAPINQILDSNPSRGNHKRVKAGVDAEILIIAVKV
jgi:hypothetical protein